MFDEEDIDYLLFSSTLTDLKNKISQQEASEEKFYWSQIIKGLLELAKDAFYREEVLSTFIVSSSDNIRDKQMADNLVIYYFFYLKLILFIMINL